MPPNPEAVTALQALSTFFLGDSPPAPGFNYTFVAIRCLARFLNRDATCVAATLQELAAQGFCEVTPWEARLTPGLWATNLSRYSSYLAYFVFRAPPCLRGPDCLVPVNPACCLNVQPDTLQGKSVTITSNATGVFSSSQYREQCEPPTIRGPFEVEPPWHSTADPLLPASLNLSFLWTPVSAATFRGFLSGLYLQGLQTETFWGPLARTLAEEVDLQRYLVLAPSDALGLQFATSGGALAGAFLAPLQANRYDFANPQLYPLALTLLAGGSATLYGNGLVALPTGLFFYQLAGATAADSYIMTLVAAAPAGTDPATYAGCPVPAASACSPADRGPRCM